MPTAFVASRSRSSLPNSTTSTGRKPAYSRLTLRLEPADPLSQEPASASSDANRDFGLIAREILADRRDLPAVLGAGDGELVAQRVADAVAVARVDSGDDAAPRGCPGAAVAPVPAAAGCRAGFADSSAATLTAAPTREFSSARRWTGAVRGRGSRVQPPQEGPAGGSMRCDASRLVVGRRSSVASRAGPWPACPSVGVGGFGRAADPELGSAARQWSCWA
jgi:hypothetical protein